MCITKVFKMCFRHYIALLSIMIVLPVACTLSVRYAKENAEHSHSVAVNCMIEVLSSAKELTIESMRGSMKIPVCGVNLGLNAIISEFSCDMVQGCKYKYASRGKIIIISSNITDSATLSILADSDSLIRCAVSKGGVEYSFYIKSMKIVAWADKLLST